jgi:hypothetical protein
MTCAEFRRLLPEVFEGHRSAEQQSHLHSCSACSNLVSDLNLIAREARTLHASEEPSPRVWNSIASEIGEIESDLQLVTHQARSLQGSEEPSPRVWNAIADQLNQTQSELNLIAEQARGLRESAEPSPRVWNSIEIALRQEGLIRQPLPKATAPRRRAWAWLAPVPIAALLIFGFLIFERVPNQPEIAFQPQPAGAPAFQAAAANSDDQQVLDTISRRAPQMRAAYESELANINAYIQDAKASADQDPNDEEAQQYLMSAYEQKAMVYQMALDPSQP